MVTNQTLAQKLMDEAKFTSAEGYVYLLPKSGKLAHTQGWKDCLNFIPDVGLPLVLRELRVTSFVID
jgi:hypothetical protein